ncbi:hypothetical protein [Yersinia ruckeri]|uniref:hypothetical protein n=1 Tax=Yersinia ruckeri TaxID=29486 RepID=UPI00223710DD|nr:hypothetical protein [Yersinia ruckeri]MCW6598866.1 hypothetical protein [Yersinia ruckeri]
MKISTITAAIHAAIVVTVTPSSSGDLGSRDMVYLNALGVAIGDRLKKDFGVNYTKSRLQWENSKFDRDYWVVTLSAFEMGSDKISIQFLFKDGTRGYILDGYRLFRNGNRPMGSQVGIKDRTQLIDSIASNLKSVGANSTEFSLSHNLMVIVKCVKTDLYRAITKVAIPNSKTVAIYPYKIPSRGNSRYNQMPTRGYSGFATSYPVTQTFTSMEDLLRFCKMESLMFKNLKQARDDDDDDLGHWKSFDAAIYDLNSGQIVSDDKISADIIKALIKDYPQLVA